MRLVVLVLLAPALAAQTDDAEKRFRAMEKRVAAAKTVRVAFQCQILEGKAEQAQFNGTVQLGDGDKGVMRIKGRVNGMDLTAEIESDGRRIKETLTPPGKGKERPLPRKFGLRVRAALARTGFIAGLPMTERRAGPDGVEKEPDLDQLLPLSEFKLGGKDTVGSQGANVIEYKARLASERQDLSVRLWLDARTQLPIKRELTGERKGRQYRIVETYSEFNLR